MNSKERQILYLKEEKELIESLLQRLEDQKNRLLIEQTQVMKMVMSSGNGLVSNKSDGKIGVNDKSNAKTGGDEREDDQGLISVNLSANMILNKMMMSSQQDFEEEEDSDED